ncbi:MAG TPA: AAA family ATPase [Puia sp.]|nr:AAA family ATPase [Puia sp.]
MFNREIIAHLEKWAAKPNRKPLILRGARQVGKTTVVNVLGTQFVQYIYLNLENKFDQQPFQESQDIHTLIQSIFLVKNQQFSRRGETLLFIDEIQQFPAAINMLRYFYEQYPELSVIAAGSLLETIFSKGLSFPVGRVEFMVIRPVSFPEFLGAIGESQVLEQLRHIPVNDFAHARLLQLFHTYALIGGMPEIVNEYTASKDLTALSILYEQLITAYIDDVEKYAANDRFIQIIRHCIRVSFLDAGTRIKFQHFGRSNYTSREVGEALRTLEKTFLLSLIYPTTDAVLPLLPDLKKSPRLQVLDTGMMNYFLGLRTDILGTTDLNKIHQGTIIEHLVGQELLAGQFNVLSSLNFWVREKPASTAEIDYVYPFESQLIPIEVKSGKDGTLRSLHQFMDEAPHDMAIRFYAGKLQITTTSTSAGKSYHLLSLPYYLASQTEMYIGWLKERIKS